MEEVAFMNECNVGVSILWQKICRSFSAFARKDFRLFKHHGAKPAIFALVLALVACSGGGGGGGAGGDSNGGGGTAGSPPQNFVVSGTVSAPGGAVAFLPARSLFQQLADTLIAPVHAAISGMAPVSDGTTVELVRINDDGTVMSVLATTKTSGGNYSFDLTALGLSAASDLVVQVTSLSSGAKMRSFVVAESVNVDPVSETTTRIVLETITATHSLVLTNFTVQELADITDAINFLITVQGLSGGIDIETTIATFKAAVSANTGIMTFVTAASALGQSLEGPGDIGNYFPRSQGDTWFYSGIVNGAHNGSFSNIIAVNGSKTLNGVSVAVLSESNSNNAGPEENYLTMGTTGVTNYGNNDAQDFLTSQVVPYREIKFPLKIGSSFEQINKSLNWPDDLDDDGYGESAKAVSTVTTDGFETVVVAAGTFANCIKIVATLTITVTLSSDGSQVTFTETDTYWQAPGVGTVKTTSVIAVDALGTIATETDQLTAYVVSGQANGVNVQVDPGGASIGLGGTQQFTATARDRFNSPIPGLTFSWTSSNPAAATINMASGLATGVTVGTTEITASALGLVSSPVTVTIKNTRQLALPANDIVYDRFRNRIYASVPAGAGSLGNSITIIDPEAGKIGPSVSTGDEPSKLAISDDGQYLYAALESIGYVERINLTSLSVDSQFFLGNDPRGMTYSVEEMKAVPGNPGSVAVVRKSKGISGVTSAGVAIYDNGVMRTNTTGTSAGVSTIAFSAAAARLYGYNNQSSSFGFSRMLVDANGVSVVDTTANMIWGYYIDIKFDGGFIYASSGEVIDPEALSLDWTYDFTSLTPYFFDTRVAPNGTTNTVYFLSYDRNHSPWNSATWRVQAYDMTTHALLAERDITGISQSAAISGFIHWGTSGVAFRTSDGAVYLIRF